MSTAMVWGASGGIGRALVKTLAEAGWETVALTRDPAAVATLAAHVFSAEVSNPAQIEAAVYAAAMEVESVDLWVYAAGDITSAKAGDMGAEDWNRILDANLTGAFLASHYSLPLLAPDAHLFFLGAVSERMRLPGLSAYAAAKVGLEAFAETLAKEERKRRVTVVRPGAVATDFWEKVPFKKPADAASPEKVAQRILQAYEEKHKGQLDLSH